jgi:hypothetical protein
MFATTVLGWFENLPSEEVPPREIWGFPRELDKHLSYIMKRRRSVDRDGEAPEGTLDDAKLGLDVTLRNQIVTKYMSDDPRNGYDDFTEM